MKASVIIQRPTPLIPPFTPGLLSLSLWPGSAPNYPYSAKFPEPFSVSQPRGQHLQHRRMICGFYQQRNRVLENIVWLALTFTNCSQTERLFPDNPSWNERFGSRGHIVAPKGPGGPISSPLSVTRTLFPVTAVERGSAESDKVACTLGMYAVGTGTRLANLLCWTQPSLSGSITPPAVSKGKYSLWKGS